ncbi:MAG: YfhO family protein, partial [Owenweeksia sp.]
NSIKLESYDPKNMKYAATVNNQSALAVFSEIYYDAPNQKWNAYIDGNKVEHIRVNYLLRGLKIPQGKHSIELKFEPKTYYMGEKIDLIASVLLFGLILVFIILSWLQSRKKPTEG